MTQFVEDRDSVHTIANEVFRRAELRKEVIEVDGKSGTYVTGRVVGAAETAARTRLLQELERLNTEFRESSRLQDRTLAGPAAIPRVLPDKTVRREGVFFYDASQGATPAFDVRQQMSRTWQQAEVRLVADGKSAPPCG
jgi:hypothetical protein